MTATLDEVLNEVSKSFSITIEQLTKKTRKREVVIARSVYYMIAHKKLGYTCTAVADRIGKDHATVLHGIKMYYRYRDHVSWRVIPEEIDNLYGSTPLPPNGLEKVYVKKNDVSYDVLTKFRAVEKAYRLVFEKNYGNILLSEKIDQLGEALGIEPLSA
jgi:Bacterial dnaA protein helix-turn-helix